MTVTIPTGVVADGQTAVWWAPSNAFSDPSYPTQAEMRAPTVRNVTGFMTADGLTTGGDEQTISDDRLSTTQSFAQPGRYSETISVRYVYDQQAAANDPQNYVYETFKRGVQGYLVVRSGVDFDDLPTDGDVVDVWPVTCGLQRKMSPEANSVLRVEQTMHVRNAVRKDAVIGSTS